MNYYAPEPITDPLAKLIVRLFVLGLISFMTWIVYSVITFTPPEYTRMDIAKMHCEEFKQSPIEFKACVEVELGYSL